MGPFQVLSPNRKRQPISNLEKQIIEYLVSNNYSEDPHKYLTDITSHQYKTLEEFISKIPSVPAIANGDDVHPEPKLGMRYVDVNDKTRRGRIVDIIPTENRVSLRMDGIPNRQKGSWTILKILFPWFYLGRYVLRILFPGWMFKTEIAIVRFNLSQLVPEKEYLRSHINPNVHPSEGDNGADGYRPDVAISIPDLVAPESEASREHSDVSSDEESHGMHSHNDTVVPLITEGPFGKRKGIEGANNSCYLDAFLMSTFYTTTIFDFLLESRQNDTPDVEKTRTILRESIVNPLRRDYFCKYQQVWDLREHLSPINEDLKGSFMDAEQVLYILCKTALKEPHFIRYDLDEDSEWGDYMLLMTPDLDDTTKIGTVQGIMKFSFAFNGDIKMASVPNPAFILGMPRSDRVLIHYKAVIPNPIIKIQKYLHQAECCHCGDKEPEWEIQTKRGGIESASNVVICETCLRADTFPSSDKTSEDKNIVSRTEMKLNAIMCIRGCHFTAFLLASNDMAYTNNQDKDTWYFFDSMAGGYPEVTIVPDMRKWLDKLVDDPKKFDTENIPADMRRSLTDGHICIYEPVLFKQ